MRTILSNHRAHYRGYRALVDIAILSMFVDYSIKFTHRHIPGMDYFLKSIGASIGISLLHTPTRSKVLNTIKQVSRDEAVQIFFDSHFAWKSLETLIVITFILSPKTRKIALKFPAFNSFLYFMDYSPALIYLYYYFFTQNSYTRKRDTKRAICQSLRDFLNTYPSTVPRDSASSQRAVGHLFELCNIYFSKLNPEPARSILLLTEHLNVTFWLFRFLEYPLETVLRFLPILSPHTSPKSIRLYEKYAFRSLLIYRVLCALLFLIFINHKTWVRSILTLTGHQFSRNADGSLNLHAISLRPSTEDRSPQASNSEATILDPEMGIDAKRYPRGTVLGYEPLGDHQDLSNHPRANEVFRPWDHLLEEKVNTETIDSVNFF